MSSGLKLKIICEGEIINKHSDGGRYYGYNNPFGNFIPNVGDFIELGEHNPEWKHREYTPMVKYVVKSRTFSAIEDSNNTYSGQLCVLEVAQVE